MKEKENTSTSNRKRFVYSIVVAACALLLVAAITLTVYFTTNGGSEVLDNPPEGDLPSGNLPSEDPPKEEDKKPSEDPSKPSGGEETVTFVAPIEASEYSVDYNVIFENRTTNKWYRHKAIDITAAEGTSVCSMGDGTVYSITNSPELGNVIVVKHDGNVYTSYRFVEAESGLKEGDAVKRGQKIATVAAAYGTEAKDGAHLHLEMSINGNPVNPSDYFNVVYENK